MFRPRLFQLKNEKEVEEYFMNYTRRMDGVYTCAGITDGNIRVLRERLKEEWKKDVIYEASRLLNDKEAL